MNLKLWKRGCAALLAGIMVWTQPLCVLAETGGSVEAAAESDEENASEEQQETVETASASDVSGDESENESGSGILTQQVVFDDAVELINDLAVESAEEDELASDSDADEIELINDLEDELASDSDADAVELTNDLLMEEDPEWITEELSYTFEWGDLVDGIPEIDFSDYILDGEIDSNAGIATLSLDSNSDTGDYWSEQIDEDALDYYGLLVDYYDAVIGGTGSVEETFSLGEIGTFEAVEDYDEEADNQLDGLKYYVYQAIYAFRYDYPMMFWEPTITCNVSLSGYKDADDLYTGTITGRIKITCDLSDSEVYDMVDEITGVVDSFDLSGDTDYAVLKSVHDQICEIADYDDTLAADYAHSAYGALVLGVSVCEGYAKAFKVFCDELGIPCVLIVGLGGSGSSYGSHMWNYVQMDDGLWYGVDVTWDDQDSGILDACFLVGSNTLDTFADTFGNMHIEEPLTIVAGDSTVYLYYPAIAEERYVESEGDTTEIVSIPDENLKAALLETGDTNGDGEMSVAEMESLSYVGASGREITDLTGMEYAVNLGDLEISNNQLTDLSPLSGLVNLYHLDLGNCGLTSESLGALSTLTNVNDLYLGGNQIDDISALAGLTGLNVLYLNDNFAVSDLSPLSGMENLWDLWLQNNLIEDLSPLSGLTNLNTLYLDANQISDLSPLNGLTNLSTLELGYNQIEDISPLDSLGGQQGQLHVLNLDGNDIVDLSPIQNLVWLNQLTVNSNQLTVMPDLTALEGLDLYQDGEPREMFVGNRITRDEFTGKFAENIEVTEAWLDLNSYDGTVVNDDTIVEIPDASLKSALLAAGDTDGDGEMTRTEMSYLTGFGDEWNGIADLTGLEYAVNLTSLGLNNNEITDISPLAGLTRLTGLELGWNQIEDISPLSGLTNLHSIMLDDNKITDISPLQELTNLTSLTLSINEIADISPLQGLTNLSSLNLSENEIGDISLLQNLTNLRDLWLNSCGLTDISVLANLTQLENLEIQYNQIGDISVLADLTNLTYLGLCGNKIVDISALQNMTRLEHVELWNNQIVDIGPLSELSNLTILPLSDNQITDISALSGLTNLTYLNIGNNQVNDISAIQNMTQLIDLFAYNNELTTVPDLRGLTELVLYDDGNPRGIFDGNQILRDEFTGKFADNIEVTEEWLDLNSYDPESATIVEIPDEALKALIVESYDTNGDGEMSVSEMRQITSLTNRSYRGITDLTGLEYATNLTDLNLDNFWWDSYAGISDLTPLSELTGLTSLSLYYNNVTDISPLSGLINLETLNLAYNQVADISALAELTGLRELAVSYGGISDISALTGLNSLESLTLEYNAIDDISALAELTNLYILNLDSNAIEDIEGLSGLTSLESLYLDDNDITDLSPIQNMTNLQGLYIRNNKLTEMPYLTELTSLSLYEEYEWDDEVSSGPRNMFSGNQIPEEEFVGKFADGIELTQEWLDLNSYDGTEVYIPDDALREALLAEYDLDSDGIMVASEMRQIDYLYLRYCGIQDLTGLEYATNLESLDLNYNEITDESISSLTGLTKLIDLNLSYNQISDLSVFSGMSSLYGLKLNGNLITDISSLPDLKLDNLTSLALGYNEISDISALAEFDYFDNLILPGNQISDISALSGIYVDYNLNLEDNQISNISALSGLDGIMHLYLANNQIGDISALAGVSVGDDLDLSNNQISDISALAGSEFEGLYIENNQISDISALANATIYGSLYMDNNNITDLSPIQNQTDLRWMTVTNNELTTVPDLTALTQLYLYEDDTNTPINIFGGNQIPREEFTGKFAEGTELTEEWLDLNSYDPETSAIVEIPDETLKALIVESYDTNGDGEMSVGEMRQITSLTNRYNYSYSGITDLTGLEYATNLTDLYLNDDWWDSYAGISDLTPLSELTSLTSLSLYHNDVTDISPLSGLINLETLNLAYNQVADISALAELTGLRELSVSNGGISDISVLAGLASLERLNLQYNAIDDISELAGLTNLYILYLDDNAIEDIEGLSGLTALESLSLNDNDITDLSPIQDMTNLQNLYIRNNQLTEMPDLTKLTSLILYDEYEWDDEVSSEPRNMFSGNQIHEEEFAGKFADGIELTQEWLDLNSYDGTEVYIPDDALREALLAEYDLDSDGIMVASEMRQIVYLYLRYCGIQDLTGLEYATNLEYLDLNYNEITDESISSLTGLTKLTDLNLSYNQISDLNVFSGMSSLYRLRLNGNLISDISPLPDLNLDNLITLALGDNQISDISALSGFDYFENLILWGNQISDISPLAGLEGVDMSLNLSNNQISDISALAEIIYGVGLLQLNDNQITDISPLADIEIWSDLELDNNSITDLSPIQNQTDLHWMTVTNNQLTTVPDLTALTNLTLYEDDTPINMFGGNQIPREEFTGKFAEGIELTEEWLDLNSYVSSGETPVITTQPVSAVGEIGDTITFAVEADGAVSYIWYYSADDGDSWKLLKTWEGYDTDTLSFELTSNRLNYLYHCVLTGSDGSTVTTDDVCVQETGLTIVTQPVSVTASIGDTVTYTVEALKAVSYNWYYSADDGDSWSILKSWDGYDTAELSFEVTSNRLNYRYHCVVKGSDGTTLTTDDVYVEEQGFAILEQPESAVGEIGDTITFTTEAVKAVSYNWYYSTDSGETWKLLKEWDGYDTNTLSFELTSLRLSYLYHCVVKGSDGSTLTTDNVYVEEQEFAILTQPESVTASIGDTVTFVTEAAKAVSYNWYYSADSGESWKLLKSWDGYDTNTLSFEVTGNRLNYLYHCVVKGSDGTTLTTDAVSIETK